MDNQRIGFIGTGLMGHGVAANLLKSGHQLTILRHRSRANTDDLLARGASGSSTLGQLAAGCVVVFTCLPSSAEVEDVVLGESGLVAGLRPGSVLVDLTTADPASTRRIGAELARIGCDMIDAPVGRSPREAEAGHLSTFVGGRPDVIARVRPIISCYADTIVEAGVLGDGHTLKLLSNFISIGTSALVAEAVATAKRLGIDVWKFREVVTPGATNSRMFQMMLGWPLEGDESGLQARIRTAAKDLSLYRALAEPGGRTRIAAAMDDTYREAVASGYGEAFMPRLIDALAEYPEKR